MQLLNTKRLLQHSAVLMAARVGGAFLALGLQVMLARHLGAHEFGLFALGSALAAVASLLCVCGFPAVAARNITHYAADGLEGLKSGFIRSSYAHVIVAGTAFFGIAGLALFGPFFDLGSDARLALFVGCATAPLIGMLRVTGSLANVERRFALAFLPDLLARPAGVLALAAAIVWAGYAGSAAAFLMVQLGVIALAAAWQYGRLRPLGHVAQTPQYDNGRWRRQAAPLIIITAFTSFFAELDLLLLGLVLPTGEVAVFSVCLRLTAFIAFGIHTVHQIVLPDLSEARAQARSDLVASGIQRANRVNLAATLAALGVLAVLGERVLGIFGPDYKAGYHVLMILAATQVVRAAAGPVMQLLTLGDAQHRSVPWLVASLAMLAVANALVVPSFGMPGAAAVYAAVTVFWCAALGVQVFRFTGYRPWQLLPDAARKASVPAPGESA